ncbi:restriction endonuclease subunit S [Aeromonas veronii]|uniref:restriction endonuclease subunit S n=1 Tax=Aeromonas veronii TaxID=654 RepID=UPI003D1E8498
MLTEKQLLPSGWVKLKLSNAIEPRGEKISPQKFPDLPFIGMDHVEPHTTKILGSVPAREMKSNAACFYAGDVLYGRLRPYLNKVAQPKNDGLASAEFIVFSENELIKSSFLKYRLNAHDFVRFANHLNEGDRPRVSFEQIGDFDLLIPPPTEQERIANKLDELFSELDKGVENLRTAQQQLKVYRQALLKHAFEGKLTAKWRAQNPDKLESAEALLERIQKEREACYQQQLAEWRKAQQAWEAAGKIGSKPAKPKAPKVLPALTVEELVELPELPKGWGWVRPEEIAAPERYSIGIGPFGSNLKVEDYRESGVPLIFVRNITRSDFTRDLKYIDHSKYLELEAHSVKPLDLVITKMGDPPGDCEIYPAESPMAVLTADCLKFRLWSEFADRQLYKNCINSNLVRKQLGLITKGVAQKKISVDRFKTICLPLMCIDEQQKIEQELDEKFSVIDQLEKNIVDSLVQAEVLRQSILKKAFSGRLVPQLPDDEPASVLLERIRSEHTAQQPARKRGRKVATSV